MIKGKLKTYAEIFSGFSFRALPVAEERGIITVVQPKDIDRETSRLVYQTALKTNEFSGDPRHFLRSGDILVSAKGKSTPIVLFEGVGKKVVGSSSLTVIRVKEEILVADYMAWYLQLPATQQYLQSSKTGTTVLNLSVKAVEEMECWLPGLAEQQKIGRLHKALLEKKAIQLELLEMERRLINHQLYQEFITNQQNK